MKNLTDDYRDGSIDMLHALATLTRAAPPGARTCPHAITFSPGSAKPSLFIFCSLPVALDHFDESPTIDTLAANDSGELALTWAHPVGTFVGLWTLDEIAAAGLWGAA